MIVCGEAYTVEAIRCGWKLPGPTLSFGTIESGAARAVYNSGMHWGAYITDARTRAGLTVEQLALRSGFEAALIDDWEFERECPRVDEFVAVLRAAGFAPVLRLVEDDGVDLAQIERHLAMTPDERMDLLITAANWLLEGREAMSAAGAR